MNSRTPACHQQGKRSTAHVQDVINNGKNGKIGPESVFLVLSTDGKYTKKYGCIISVKMYTKNKIKNCAQRDLSIKKKKKKISE